MLGGKLFFEGEAYWGARSRTLILLKVFHNGDRQ
jgi:hypothetical protein